MTVLREQTSPNPERPGVIAYLVNVYPKVSHSFIRREILAHEAAGHAVLRVSIRGDGDVADPDDKAEAGKTHVLLGHGVKGLLLPSIRVKTLRMARWFRASMQAWRMGRANPRVGVIKHFVYLMEAAALTEHLEAHGATHLHAHFGTNPAAVARLTHTLSGIPYSFTVHGPEEFDAPLALSLPEKINDAKFVVAITSYCRSQLFRWLDYDQWHKVTEVHCGLDPVFFEDNAVTAVPREGDASRTFVCVGRLCEQKGQLLLIDALAALRDAGHDARLVLVGDGEMRREVERAIAVHGLTDRVTITGWASAEAVRGYLRQARAMVLPSFAEGLPVVIMEALAMGRPVVSTYIAGIPELVDETCGWLVPAGDLDRLTDALAACLSAPPESLDEMGQEGARRVRARHHAPTEAKTLRDAIAEP
ncbi:MAG: glycosyltransferase family 4 protein [Planctomycetota bacterium]